MLCLDLQVGRLTEEVSNAYTTAAEVSATPQAPGENLSAQVQWKDAGGTAMFRLR